MALVLRYFHLDPKATTSSSSITTTLNLMNTSISNNTRAIEDKLNAITGKSLSSNDFTDYYKDKLRGIEEGAEVNVLADWDENDSTADSYIKNKPIIDTVVTENSDNLITSGAVYTAIDNLPEPMIFKGSLGTGGTILSLPSASSSNKGYTYKVITDDTYNGLTAKAGDVFISDGTTWVYIPSADEPNGTVTNIAVTVPTGLEVSGSPITTTGTIAITYAIGYAIPTLTDQAAWTAKQDAISDLSTIRSRADEGHTAYGWGNHANAGYLMAISDLATIRSRADEGHTAYGWGDHSLAGYLTGITSAMVTAALGYTPPTSDTNTWRPITNTYTGSDLSTSVSQYGTNALYNALVNGYASSAGNADTVDGYHASSFALDGHTHSYLPLSGGTLTGVLTLNPTNGGSWASNLNALIMKGASSRDFSFKFSGSGTNVDVGWDWAAGHGSGLALRSAGSDNGSFILYARNSTSAEYALTGTTGGVLTWSNRFKFSSLSDIPESASNLSNSAITHGISFYRNGFLIPYLMDNVNDGGMLRVRGTSESNCIFELGTWDDSGSGETILFNYYPTTSTVTPTYSVTVPKKTGTIALTSDIPTNLNQLSNGPGYITSSGSCNYATSAGNADTVDGYHASSFLQKTTYDYHKEFSAGGTSYIEIGCFTLYDSQVGVDITLTTTSIWTARLVIASQNINSSGAGAYTVKITGDNSLSLQNNFSIVRSGAEFRVYLNCSGWKKVFCHIWCVAAQASELFTTVSSMPTGNISITNYSGIFNGDVKSYASDGFTGIELFHNSNKSGITIDGELGSSFGTIGSSSKYMTMWMSRLYNYCHIDYPDEHRLYVQPFNPAYSPGYFDELGAWRNPSDISFKTNIHKLSKYEANALYDWMAVKGLKEFTWVNTNITGFGVIALEVEEVAEDVVERNPDNDKLYVDYTRLHSKMIAAVVLELEDTKEEIELLRAQIAELKLLLK